MNKLLIMIISFSFLSCGAAGDNNTSGTSTDRSIQGSDSVVITSIEQREVFSLVNDHRTSVGLSPLKWHSEAIIQSQKHSFNMANSIVRFGHAGYNQRMDTIETEDNHIKATGENVAQNHNPSRAVKAWLRSYGHRRNIEGNYTHTGIGASVDSAGSWYFTQIFLRK